MKPDEDHYGNNAREAKLLYVAITLGRCMNFTFSETKKSAD